MAAAPLPHSHSRLPARHFLPRYRQPSASAAGSAYGGAVAMGTHRPLRAGGGGGSGRHGGSGGRRGGPQRRREGEGSRDNVSPSADKHETSQLQTKTCFDLGTEKKTSVTFKHVHKFSNNEVSLQDGSQAESIQASQENPCCGIVRPAPAEKKTQTSRSLMKLRRRTKALVSEEGETVRDVYLINANEMVKNQIASTEELRSPVFRRSGLSNTEENARRASRPALVQREENSSTPPNAALGVVQEMLEDSVPPGEPELFPCALSDSSDVWQPESPSAVAASDNCEPAWPCSGNSDSVLLDTSGDGGTESSSIIKQMDGESMGEDQGELHRLLDLMSENEVLPTGGNNDIINDSKSHEGDQSDTNSLNLFPTDLALGNAEELLENQQLEIQSKLSHPEKVTTPESALNSCTVVEGLLFPVEYYVRTTRRVSNCQRKVDLDAVILSQLGRSKKGQRSKCKQKDANSGRLSQERIENDLESGVTPFPFLGAENDPNSSSSQKPLPASSGSSTSLGSISQNSITSTKRDQRQSQRKQKGRRKSTCKPPVQQVSQELIGSLDLTTRESSSLRSNECQSEKENCEASLEKSSSDERRLSAAAALGSGETEVTGAIQPMSADPPGGSQVLGKCRKTLLEQVQNPLQNSDPLNPGNEAFASCIGDLEANLTVREAGKHPVEHVKDQQAQGARRAEELLVINVPPRRSLRSSARQRASQVSKDESKRGCSYPMGSEGPASLGLPAMDTDTCSSLFSFRSLQWLAPRLGIRDFHLPDEEFGLLKLEKLESSPVNDLEAFVPSVFGDGVASEDAQDAQMNPEEKSLESNLILPFKNGLPKLPHVESPASKKELYTHELLFTPMGTVLAGAPTQPESLISSSVFPVVGATPAVLPSVCSEVFPNTPSVPPSQASPHSSKGASAQFVDDGKCKDSAIPLHLDSCGAGSARKEEEQGTTFPLEAERGPDKSDEAVALDKHQQLESKQQRCCRASPEQEKDVAEQLTPVLLDGLREESLQLVSKLKDSSSSCAVDVSTMWWEAAGCRELCVVTACESSVSLWKPLASDCWGKVYTWLLGEIPVIQIVPLPDTCNLMCIALGDLEIGEIRLLLYSSENDSFEQSLVKTGNIKAVLGLKDRRLVSSSRTVQEQQVEIVSLSETRRSKDGQTLMPPEETVLAFAEVEGMRDALLGTTAANSIVVWNLKTGQLLKKMHVGYSYPASICHRAYSDSGLLFVVLSHPHAKESESCGNPAFRVIAFNPKTARSTGVMFSSLPPGHAGRYLEGDVKDASAAAVLTSGAVAVWDLLLGRCTALLPPAPAGSWALARWATTGACLLAGQRDGTVCLYRYRQPQPGAA
ncbi:partner and localizer of BRCA2 isoform X2 [Aquila chrysaetos chrysaetos]|uniref:partner and localizer of BRCA2 isoform X2 n=1 Tax=Aquila chrysaetos chrysaetos TaxID=223781 RepID=UPI0011771455|nr:partner and localizer of BRCA2 isoform X2 [Aquila chrysaetos chrysaetos]